MSGSRTAAGWLLAGTLCGALVAGRLETGLLCAAVAGVTAAVLGAPWPSPRWRWMLAASVALGWVLNLYLTPGAPLPGWPVVLGRMPTRDGLALGGLLTLRLLGATVSLQGLRAAWPGERAADMAAGTLRPLQRWKVPVEEARAMLGLAVRFAPLLEREARRIADVQALRAGRPPRGAREWLERQRAAAVPTLVSALERADRVALALEARHYRLRPAGGPETAGGTALGWRLAAATVFAAALLWRRG